MSWNIIDKFKQQDGSIITLTRQWFGYDIDWERNGNRKCIAFEIKNEENARKEFELIKRGMK